jgi:TonB family protein
MMGAIDNLRLSGAADVAASPLAWAALLSVALHGAIVVLPQAPAGGGIHATFDRSTPISATLSAPAAEAFAAEAVLAAAGPAREPDIALPASPPTAATQAASPGTPMRFGNGVPGGILVRTHTLEDRNRLGDLLSRQISEFPVEVDLPVRLRDPVAVRYPSAALAAGRQGSVVVWIVVNAQGKAEEVQVVDGSQEFSAVVLEALRDIYFLPAQNNRRLIAFPLSLEFSFRLPVAPGIRPDAPGTARRDRPRG